MQGLRNLPTSFVVFLACVLRTLLDATKSFRYNHTLMFAGARVEKLALFSFACVVVRHSSSVYSRRRDVYSRRGDVYSRRGDVYSNHSLKLAGRKPERLAPASSVVCGLYCTQ